MNESHCETSVAYGNTSNERPSMEFEGCLRSVRVFLVRFESTFFPLVTLPDTQACPELGVAVADDLHGKGLGTAVVCVLVGLAKALGKSGVELTTMKGNDAAFRCYQRCGFEEQVRFF